MEADRFDALSRALGHDSSRRMLLHGGLVAFLGSLGLTEAAAKKRKKRKKKKGKGQSPPVCTEVGDEASTVPCDPCICLGPDNVPCIGPGECGEGCCGGECCRSTSPSHCCLNDDNRPTCCANRGLRCLLEESSAIDRCCPADRDCSDRCCQSNQVCVRGQGRHECCRRGRECPNEQNGQPCCREGWSCKTEDNGETVCLPDDPCNVSAGRGSGVAADVGCPCALPRESCGLVTDPPCCGEGRCEGTRCCLPLGARTCRAGFTDCCSAHLCQDGKCCLPEYGNCTDDTVCCGDLTCIGGHCCDVGDEACGVDLCCGPGTKCCPNGKCCATSFQCDARFCP
jgi:hypothetical protein